MYPMDFEEYLIAFDENMLLDYIKECFEKNKPMGVIHEKAMYYYRNYMITGGMPESGKGRRPVPGSLAEVSADAGRGNAGPGLCPD